MPAERSRTDPSAIPAVSFLLSPFIFLRRFGIDPAITIPDHNGRPQFLLDDRAPLAALI